jgi:hypothetical protein
MHRRHALRDASLKRLLSNPHPQKLGWAFAHLLAQCMIGKRLSKQLRYLLTIG